MKKLLLMSLICLCIADLRSQCSTSSAPTNNCASYGDEIDAFTLDGIAATGVAGCSTNGYGLFPSPVWNLMIGQTYTFSAAVGSGTEQQGLAIWIDLNNDNVYAATEMLFSSSAPSTSHTGSISIPFTAAIASNVRMRVRCAYFITIVGSDVCTNGLGTWGETEDHFVNIVCPSGNPTLNVASTGTYVCLGTPVTLTASGAQSYTWTGNITNATSFTPSATQTYTVTGGIQACPAFTGTAAQTISVTSTPLPVSATISPGTICAGSQATVTATGASNFTFTPGPASGGTANVLSVNPTSSITYSVKGYNGSGCPGYATVAINVNPVPTLTAGASAFSICAGESVTLTASGASTYSWSVGGTSPTIVLAPMTSTNYVLTGTNSFNCSSSTSTVVLVYDSPTVNAISSHNMVCIGGTATLIASGAASYAWMGGPGTNTYVVSPTAMSEYTVTGFSSQGCSAEQTVSVNVYVPVLTTGPSTAVCAGNSATLTAIGGSNYTWVGIGSGPQIVVTPAASTIYTVTALSTSVGITCPSKAMVSVSVNPNPTVTAGADKAQICRFDEVTLNAGGAGTSGTYSWTANIGTNPGAGASVPMTLSVNTTYSFTVKGTDANGCSNTAIASVKVIPCADLAESTWSGGLSIYPNPTRGIFTVKASQAASVTVFNNLGQSLKQFSLGSGASEQVDFSELPAGIYMVVSDSQGRQSTTRLVITK
jgi:hypothetical protein